MSDQDYDRDHEHHDWLTDAESPDSQEQDAHAESAHSDDYRSDGERVSSLVPASDMLPERIYLLPIHNRPFFPAQVQPLVINRERWEETMRRVGNTPHHTIGVAFVGEQGVESLDHEGFPEIGTAVKVHKLKS